MTAVWHVLRARPRFWARLGQPFDLLAEADTEKGALEAAQTLAREFSREQFSLVIEAACAEGPPPNDPTLPLPSLDDVGEGAYDFAEARSPIPWEDGAHATILTTPGVLFIRDPVWVFKLRDSAMFWVVPGSSLERITANCIAAALRDEVTA